MNSYLSFEQLNVSNPLEFVWIELTNKCNLKCIHCYTNSSPESKDNNPLSLSEYIQILDQSKAGGSTGVQFIGGEPTLNKMLPKLVEKAHELNFEMIEVYTNLFHLSDELLTAFIKCNVRIATSIYSSDPVVHDLVTTRVGSWNRTLRNVERVQKAGLSLRASIVVTDVNSSGVEETISWLHSIGIQDVGTDEVREFGRASGENQCDQGELCGECSYGKLCISPEGKVSPCIMSKSWSVGSVKESSIEQILNSELLFKTRKSIYENTIAKQNVAMGGCNPDRSHPCSPDRGGCSPCSPNGHCGPNACRPTR